MIATGAEPGGCCRSSIDRSAGLSPFEPVRSTTLPAGGSEQMGNDAGVFRRIALFKWLADN